MISILYVRGCIIEADKEDTDHDVLSKKDIKKININLSNDIYYDIQHNLEPVQGCRLIENAVVDYPVTIANQTVNEGSWLCVIEVDNEDLEDLLLKKKVKGFSLFSYGNGASSYNELIDTSDVHPLFISFVEYPANQVLFEVLDRDMYISKMEAVKLADEEKSLIDKIKDLLKSYDEKAEEPAKTEEPVKAEEPAKEEKPAEEKPAEEEKEIAKEETVNKDKPAQQYMGNPDVSQLGEQPDKAVVENQPKGENINAVAKEGDEEVKETPAEEGQKQEPAKQEPPVAEKTEEAVPGEKKETQEGAVEKDESGVTNQDILNAINALTEAIASQQTVEEVPLDSEVVDEEPETYIIKQATQKTDKVVENKKEKKQYFDMLGRKIE